MQLAYHPSLLYDIGGEDLHAPYNPGVALKEGSTMSPRVAGRLKLNMQPAYSPSLLLKRTWGHWMLPSH